MTSRKSSDPALNVLVVDDDVALADSLKHYLTRVGCNVHLYNTAESVLDNIDSANPEVIISDFRMPGMTGLELLKNLRETAIDTPLIFITAHGDVALAVEAMRNGAFDFIEKPFEPEHLFTLAQRAARVKRLGDDNKRLRAQLVNLSGLEKSLIGNSQAIRELRTEISDVANTDASVLIYGETGTGKEVVARGLHNLSERSAGPFVALNCAAIPEQLFESTLFGHTSGAFTGASRASSGQFVAANKGTLFLDELSSLPLEMQPKLLRALQEREVLPVGGLKPVRFDARIVAAVNQPLDDLVRQGAFRDDLYFRLNTISLNIPPLRKRSDDIPLLFAHRLERFSAQYGVEAPSIGADDIEALLAHRWPGNVRELESVAERMILASRRAKVSVNDIMRTNRSKDGGTSSLRERVEAYEALLIKQALAEYNGDVGATAKALDTARRTLDEKIARHEIDRAEFRES
ncbi:MAG: sigma-54 dependent transcriptional regulator [Pseudomonadota bacterium]